MSIKHVLGLISCLSICCMDVFALEVQEDIIPTEEINIGVEENMEEQSIVCEVTNPVLLAENYERALQDLTACNISNNADCKSERKTFMYYTSVTAKSTEQYKLLNSDECYTDTETGIRMVGSRYCIALGSGYNAHIGSRVDLVLKNGSVIKCIMAEFKSDKHTDKETHTYHVGGYENGVYYEGDGSVVEFIVDRNVFSEVREDKSGTVNWVNGFDGELEKVVVIPDDVTLTEDL